MLYIKTQLYIIFLALQQNVFIFLLLKVEDLIDNKQSCYSFDCSEYLQKLRASNVTIKSFANIDMNVTYDMGDAYERMHNSIAIGGKEEITFTWDVIFRDSTRFWIHHVLMPVVLVIGVIGNIITVFILSRKFMRSSSNMYEHVMPLFRLIDFSDYD